MPLPKPNSNEKNQDTFISRCVSDDGMQKEFPDQKQRLGVCFSIWKKAKQRNKIKGSTEDPKWEDFSDSRFLITQVLNFFLLFLLHV